MAIITRKGYSKAQAGKQQTQASPARPHLPVDSLKYIFLTATFSFLLNTAAAHPGIGMVVDSRGNIFYTDLRQVYMVTGNGKVTVAVKNVHTHELFIDAKDNLYGEHLWYNGEQLNTWGHYVWRLRTTGELDTIIKRSPGFLKNYSFVRDGQDNMYWADQGKITHIRKKGIDGKITTIAAGSFKNIRWMYATKRGELCFTDVENIYKINLKGQCHMLAREIATNTSRFNSHSGKHSIFGLWEDRQQRLYFADFGGRVVGRINADGKIENVACTEVPWSPANGLFDKKGNLWLLEYSSSNEARVRIVRNPGHLGVVPASRLAGETFLKVALIIAFTAVLSVLLKNVGAACGSC